MCLVPAELQSESAEGSLGLQLLRKSGLRELTSHHQIPTLDQERAVLQLAAVVVQAETPLEAGVALGDRRVREALLLSQRASAR